MATTIPAGHLHSGHIGMIIKCKDVETGEAVHAEVRQIYHTGGETFINTNPLDFWENGDRCNGAADEWSLDKYADVELDGEPDLEF